jgi:hypothetical protein
MPFSNPFRASVPTENGGFSYKPTFVVAYRQRTSTPFICRTYDSNLSLQLCSPYR